MGIKHCNYNSKITLLLSLDVMHHKTWSINRTRRIVKPDPSSNNIVNIILAYLLLNTMQEIIVCKIIHHIICNQVTYKLEHPGRFLLVVRGKNGIGKNQVIKAISQASDIIGKINSIFITASTRAVANSISESTLHIALGINI